MPTLVCPISQSLQNALQKLSRETREPISHLVSSALSQFTGVPLHTLFQVSTSGALVQGVYQKAVSSHLLLHHGDFGLGTFENLDGEMVVLEGAIYQVRSDGTVTKIVEDVGTPFAVVVHFVADQDEQISNATSFQDLTEYCDRYRGSNNLFYAFRVDGHFHHVHTRAMRATTAPLAQAAAVQPEFNFDDVDGTLVGIWAPQFSSAINVAGYHFHFLSADRTKGGHLLDCSGSNLRVRVERLNDLHLSLPESEEFLRADLLKDTSKELAYAEQIRLLGLLASKPQNAVAVHELIEGGKLPVVGTFQAAGAVSMNLFGNFGGRVGQINNQPADEILAAGDLVITIGYDPVEYWPSIWNKGNKRPIVHLDALPADIDRSYSPSVELVGDIASTLRPLTARRAHPRQDLLARADESRGNSPHFRRSGRDRARPCARPVATAP